MAHSGTTSLSPKFLQMVIQLHENQCGQVRLNGDLSEPFPNSNAVKQGRVLAPTLFSNSFTVMLKQATEDLDDDEVMYVRYCLDGNLFNLRRLQAHTKMQERLIQNLRFPDDAAHVPHAERALQQITSCFADASACLAYKSASRRRRFFTSQLPLNIDHPTSALATLN